MAPAPTTTTRDEDVFALTDKGNAQLKSSATSLSVAELEILVLIDGNSTVAQIAGIAGHLGRQKIDESLRKLFGERLITTATEPSSDGLESGYFSIAVPAGFFSSVPGDNAPELEAGVSSLKQRGYFVRIARRPATVPERPEGWRPTVLVIDDDPDMIKLINTFLKMDGYGIRIARKRDEIMVAFRQAPMPDLVLLDVEMPDANGFDILVKLRQHPVLKSLPVIMLTASATREAVLKGLQGGADGYVTKPVEPDLLTTAIRTVLGLGQTSGKKD